MCLFSSKRNNVVRSGYQNYQFTLVLGRFSKCVERMGRKLIETKTHRCRKSKTFNHKLFIDFTSINQDASERDREESSSSRLNHNESRERDIYIFYGFSYDESVLVLKFFSFHFRPLANSLRARRCCCCANESPKRLFIINTPRVNDVIALSVSYKRYNHTYSIPLSPHMTQSLTWYLWVTMK